jgi:hypothetical protein
MTKTEIKRLKLEKDQIVCVVWNDIVTQAGWMEEKNAVDMKPSEVRSFGAYGGTINGGVLVKHNVGDLFDSITKEIEPEFDGTIIPIGTIIRIRKLRIQK